MEKACDMRVVKTDASNPSLGAIAEAVDVIERGGVVVFPTETVYGIAADAFDEDAVRRVYEIKKRPMTQPLPVMVASVDLVGTVAREVPPEAERLMREFCPGPLTLILKRNLDLPDVVTAGGDAVGVRIPDHPVALKWLRALGRPIVATSANVHAGPEPKTADEAVAQIGEGVDLVIDAGEVHIGVASTIIDMTVSPPKVLRTGVISKEKLEKEIGEVRD